MNVYVIYGIVVLLAAVCGYVAFAEGYQDKVYRVIYRLVCGAEEEITGSKRGQERKAQVVRAIHDWLPRWARLFISEQDIDDLIELAVEKMKQLLCQEAEEAEVSARMRETIAQKRRAATGAAGDVSQAAAQMPQTAAQATQKEVKQ